MLVRLPSALAHELADADTAVLFGRHHLQLLNDPDVCRLLAATLDVNADERLPAVPAWPSSGDGRLDVVSEEARHGLALQARIGELIDRVPESGRIR